jgi:hypothetical protein
VVCISLDLNAATCRLCEGRLQVVWQKDESGRRNVDHNFCQCTACVDNNRQLRHRDLNTTTYIHRLLSTELAAKGRPACLHPQIRGNTGKHSWGKRPQTLVRIRIGRNENLGAYVFISGSVLSGTGVNSETENGSQPWTVNISTHPLTSPGLFDRPSAICSSFSFYSSSLRGCPTNLYLVSPGGLVFSTTNLLVLMTALRSWYTNPMRLLPLIELISARIPRTRALCSTIVSLSSSPTNTFSRLFPYLFFFVLICPVSLDD